MANDLKLIQKDTVDVVAKKISEYQEHGQLHLPENYSAPNAIKSAWLILQETKDKNDKPALEVCTRDSIANSLLSMVVQGLDPNKKQCYMIVRGNKLTLSRSYFGSIAVAKRVDETIEDIYPEVVYSGDIFVYEKRRGHSIIVEHKQKLENIDKGKIIAAYCTVVHNDSREYTVIMSMDQIKQAWRMSTMNVFSQNGDINPGSVHGKFTEEMCKKTVVNRICKMIINSSDDRNLVVSMAQATETETTKAEVDALIEAKANREVIDGEYKETPETGQSQEGEPSDPSGFAPANTEQQTLVGNETPY